MSIRVFGKSALWMTIIALWGCAKSTAIRAVVTDPRRYENREITLTGIAIQPVRVPFADRSIYRLRDESGAIWVLGVGEPPSPQERRTVRGTVRTGLTIGNKTFAVLLQEGGKR